MIPLSYYFVLPCPAAFANLNIPSAYDDDPSDAPTTAPYTPIPTSDSPELDGHVMEDPKRTIALSAAEKWALVKPLLSVYMLPLCRLACFRDYMLTDSVA